MMRFSASEKNNSSRDSNHPSKDPCNHTSLEKGCAPHLCCLPIKFSSTHSKISTGSFKSNRLVMRS